MPDIMIRCPATGASVSTGISTATITFETLPNVAVPMQCPACNMIHKWTPKDAWVFPGMNAVKRPDAAASTG